MNEFMSKIYGTNDESVIVGKKQEGHQAREKAMAKKPARIKIDSEECKKLCRSVGLEYHDGLEDRVIQYTCTDETVDRYGDIIIATGANLKNYKQNPVILLFHDMHQYPVGRSIKTWIDKEARCVRSWVLFFDNEIDNTGMSETAFGFAKAGAMNTGSIGFLPEPDGARIPSEEERKELKMPRYGVIYEKWEMLEFSLVPVPANPNARQEKGIKIENSDFKTQLEALWEQFLEAQKSVDEANEKNIEEKELQTNSENDTIKTDTDSILKEVLKNQSRLISAINCLSIQVESLHAKGEESTEQVAPDSGIINEAEEDYDTIAEEANQLVEDLNNLEV